jgi:hypothetical protein
MVYDIEPDWKLNDHPDRLALVVNLSLAWYEGGCGSQIDLRSCRKKYFHREWQSLFLRSLD